MQEQSRSTDGLVVRDFCHRSNLPGTFSERPHVVRTCGLVIRWRTARSITASDHRDIDSILLIALSLRVTSSLGLVFPLVRVAMACKAVLKRP